MKPSRAERGAAEPDRATSRPSWPASTRSPTGRRGTEVTGGPGERLHSSDRGARRAERGSRDHLAGSAGAALTIDAYRDSPQAAGWLHDQLGRLDEPLRVAIAGKVKAGKSTLLNALVGEQVAPTDAGECTRVVTWYRDGTTPRSCCTPARARRGRCRSAGDDGALTIDLGRRPPRSVERLVVTGRRRACAPRR